MYTTKQNKLVLPALFFITIAVALGSLFLGRFEISISEIFLMLKSLVNPDIAIPAHIKTILFGIRMPRVFAAFLVGGALSLTGAAYQGIFHNPMVSPSILGVSAGAGFGAALAILLALSSFWIQTLSFIFGISAVLSVYIINIAIGKRYNTVLTLILSGMVVGTVFSALLSVLKYVADPYDALPSIIFWIMGSLAEIEFSSLQWSALIVIPGLIFMSLVGWKLDLLSFGDDEARSMGLNVDRFRFIVILVTTLMTASVVSISGIIGWIGLLVPHIARMMVGPKNCILLPASFFIGSSFLILVDSLSRSVTSMEIPLGIVTSLLGAPFFVFIFLRMGHKE